MIHILKIIYKFINYNSVSTYVSESAKSNALSLNRDPVLIPNMIEINKNKSFNNIEGYLFIGHQERRKNFDFYVKLSNHNLFKNKLFYSITNKDTSDKNILPNPKIRIIIQFLILMYLINFYDLKISDLRIDIINIILSNFVIKISDYVLNKI